MGESESIRAVVKHALTNLYRATCYHSYDVMNCKKCRDSVIDEITEIICNMSNDLAESYYEMTFDNFTKSVCMRCFCNDRSINSCFKSFRKLVKKMNVAAMMCFLIEVAMTGLVDKSLVSFSTRGRRYKMSINCIKGKRRFPDLKFLREADRELVQTPTAERSRKAYLYKGAMG